MHISLVSTCNRKNWHHRGSEDDPTKEKEVEIQEESWSHHICHEQDDFQGVMG